MSTMNRITTTYTKQKTTAPTNHKIWDGYLQLNSSVVFATIACFESGAKMPIVKWPKFVEVTGRVKLREFEDYILDLPRSRNRQLTVVSLSWKEGTSKIGLEGMKKVVKQYVEDGRVGVAKNVAGIDLYVCPRTSTILTILANYGLTIEKNKDFLIGCVVWRKSHNSIPQILSGKTYPPIQTPSQTRMDSKSSRKNVRTPKVWSPFACED